MQHCQTGSEDAPQTLAHIYVIKGVRGEVCRFKEEVER